MLQSQGFFRDTDKYPEKNLDIKNSFNRDAW